MKDNRITISINTTTSTKDVYQRIATDFNIPFDDLTSAALDWALEDIAFLLYAQDWRNSHNSSGGEA